ncbi:RDD family protein [Streptomyces longwoodensis]|uniref:RDD family protein n=1 Tax=Streptomyces longwoodensis TaxID=68231 RepID=UPI0036FDFA82
MSAPTPAPGDDRPREGYYPDPSIPGYVRYWNGASWVPGTSRPAPSDGRPLSPPDPDPATDRVPVVETTGPHFFDEDPRPEGTAPAWGADRSQQSGFGGDQDRRVSWGTPPADPRIPAAAASGAAPAPGDPGSPVAGDTPNPADPAGGNAGAGAPGGTVPPDAPAGQGAFGPPGSGPAPGAPGAAAAFGAPVAPVPGGPGGHPAPGTDAASAVPGSASRPVRDDGTLTFRAPGPRTGRHDGASPASAGAAAQGAGAAPGASGPAFAPAGQGPAPAPGTPAPAADPTAPAARPGFAAGPAAAERAPSFPAAAQPVAPQPGVPGQPAAPATPVTSGPGGGQPSWAQQVHRLAGAGDDQPVVPWKPPVEDVFQAAARRQASARPAGLGRRLAARFVDSLVLGAVTAVAAVPLGTRALDHVQEKIDAAKLSGRTVTVWILDGTTSVYLGIVVAVLLLAGVLYEALPTAKWGRTLGKKLLGLQVRDIEGHEPPAFGAALRRWLVYSVPGLLAVGLVGLVWGLFDRPWRQCWHDKAAHTFVAG